MEDLDIDFTESTLPRDRISGNGIFEDITENIEEFNVFGILNESLNLLDMEHLMKEKVKGVSASSSSDEELYSADNSTHHGSEIFE